VCDWLEVLIKESTPAAKMKANENIDLHFQRAGSACEQIKSQNGFYHEYGIIFSPQQTIQNTSSEH
jgi:hypothetical protein